ncbi:MAG: dienelactone hydrolase family protein [Spongiibacteraceae bacterium]|jgi:dienelactone hydrolase|nr:dienelactone hydrolase family protein [Spongiibacteraceae bacterium]
MVRSLLVTLLLAGSVAVVNAQPAFSPEQLAEFRRQQELRHQLPDTEGSGPYASLKEQFETLPSHVIYRPADLSALNDPLPVLVFGNGGCSDDGASARLFLSEIASHGYLAIAPGTIKNGPGVEPPPAIAGAALMLDKPTAADDLLAALDWAEEENQRTGSLFEGRIATDRMAVAGYSCGGLQAIEIAGDERLKTVVVMNSGTLNPDDPGLAMMHSSKEWLERFHTPVLYLLGGESDVAYANGMDDFARIDGVPVMVANSDVGHDGTYWDPNGGDYARVVTAWLDWHLKGSETAATMFQGENCGLCVDAKWAVAKKQID